MSNRNASHSAGDEGGLQGGSDNGKDGLPSHLHLNSGRSICLSTFTQTRAYAGLIDGVPTRRMNKRLIDRVVAQASLGLFEDKKPFLIEPIEIDISSGEALPKVAALTDREGSQRAMLPPIVCVAELYSLSPARDQDEFYSSVCVIWFQNDYAFPIDPEVVKKIRAIDWDWLAVDWSP